MSFQFKQFTVAHDRCAMKVGFDAVILGSWATVPPNAFHVLDIGTGSGIIALMLAQRTQETTTIYGIEYEPNAYEQACYNTQQSKWAKRVNIVHANFNEVNSLITQGVLPPKFDAIASNPPYFENHLLPPSDTRKKARHATELTYTQLLKGVGNLLSEEGVFSVILPHPQAISFRQQAANDFGLYCQKAVSLRQTEDKPIKRWLLQFGFTKPLKPQQDQYIIGGTHPSLFNQECKQLTQPFYLVL